MRSRAPHSYASRPAFPGRTVGRMDAAVERTGMYSQRVPPGKAGRLARSPLQHRFLILLFIFLCCTGIASAGTNTILVLGDSLSAAFGIDQAQGWVALLQQRLLRNGREYQVINASISGETTAGGLSRLPALLQQHRPDIVILALGANDGLRGLSLGGMRANLKQMIELSSARGASVLLVGMQLPPNYGPAYTRLFQDVYRQLAEEEGVALVPFLLQGIGENRAWFQADGLHPTAAAQDRLLDNVWDGLERLL